MPNIEQFTTDNFRILAYLCTIKGNDDKVSITQQEIADKFGLSRATVNKIIGELKTEGYIQIDGTHIGRYMLTKNALLVYKTMNGLISK
ncbi:MAG: helix-turn-helix domain-containing protein [Agathobacter sp.]|nr:helix-turn-helix domain-containing protein [Agathobacter sp.]